LARPITCQFGTIIVGLLNDRPRPRQLLGVSRIETTGDELGPAAFDLLDGHPAILGLFPILVGELDEVNEVGVLETGSIAPAIEDLWLAEIEPIPSAEVHQRREGQKTGRIGDQRIFFCQSPIIGDALYPRQVLPGCPSPHGCVRNPSPEDTAFRFTGTGQAHHSFAGNGADFSDLLKHGRPFKISKMPPECSETAASRAPPLKGA
jgi:hypothetical protein